MAKGNNKGLVIMIVVVILLLIAGIVYANFDQVKKLFKRKASTIPGGLNEPAPGNGNTGNNNADGGNSGSTQQNGLNWNLTLKNGVYNSNEVLLLQQVLNKVNASLPVKKYSPQLVTDGDFGNNTQNALMAMTGLTKITLNQAYSYLKAGFQ